MNVSRQDIDEYLCEVKKLTHSGQYKIETNIKRQKNMQLYTDYVINEQKSVLIILNLKIENFSHILNNEHEGYEYERLYVFGVTVTLLQRFGIDEENVALYIKINKIDSNYVIIISFHKQEHLLTFPFKR